MLFGVYAGIFFPWKTLILTQLVESIRPDISWESLLAVKGQVKIWV